ncbi:terminase small subunit [Pedobacter faecalis]|uniref:terminase small subunit n=1 Tax=Pedobacter faecalis TaxID=3041495 RepID=UPI00254D8BE1|nr:terminase small subunit [Pedobacter sp. ELA7]
MAKKKPVGRPFKFSPTEFDLAWQQYFQYVDDNPWMKNEVMKSGELAGQIIQVPTARPYSEVGFCAFHNLGEKYITELSHTLLKHVKDKESKLHDEATELSNILTQARARCRAQKFEGAAVGAFNANIIARDLGMADNQNVKHDGIPETPPAKQVMIFNGQKIEF